MLPLKKWLTRRLSPLQTAGIVVLVAALAGLGYAGYLFVAGKIFDARVRAALPAYCAGIREQRKVLVAAIEAYKAHFGTYPMDNVLSRQPLSVDATNNPLLYELAGVTYNPTNGTLKIEGCEAAEAKFVYDFFHCSSLRNCSSPTNQRNNFLDSGTPPNRQLHDDPDVFALGFPFYNLPLDPEVAYAIEVSPWRYVSSAAVHNPGRFDLWIELQAKNQKVTIGNWKEVE